MKDIDCHWFGRCIWELSNVVCGVYWMSKYGESEMSSLWNVILNSTTIIQDKKYSLLDFCLYFEVQLSTGFVVRITYTIRNTVVVAVQQP